MDWPFTLPEAERQADNSQSQKARGKLSPRDGILYQTAAGSQLLSKSSWDPGRLTSTRRVAPEISSPEETHSTPEMALPPRTRDTE